MSLNADHPHIRERKELFGSSNLGEIRTQPLLSCCFPA
jgi:hypothetical protein